MATTASTWRQHLERYNRGSVDVFDAAFLERWGSQSWVPGDEDSAGAAEFHVQLVSRIATQHLGYIDGTEAAALASLRVLFEQAREATARRSKARHFETLLWHVLNRHVRPFTAKWHRRSELPNFGALDTTDEFRAELGELQIILNLFDELLLELRDGAAPPPHASPQREARIEAEVNKPLKWGTAWSASALNRETLADIDAAEGVAIKARREHYRLNAAQEHAVGLALSGGGIRSATFSLGVLTALARRNVLPKIDYLSTVSGGGYLGAFLETFLANAVEQRTHAKIGLESDDLPFSRSDAKADALGHIRQNSRYLASGSAWTRLKVAFSQLYGMFINLAAITLVVGLCAILALALREFVPLRPGAWQAIGIASLPLAACALLLPVVMGLVPRSRRFLDRWVAIAASVQVAVAAIVGLCWLHIKFDPSLRLAWLAAPLLVILASIVAGKLVRGAATFFRVIAGLSVPLFLLSIYFNLFALFAAFLAEKPLYLAGAAAALTLVLATYWWCLDVNFTGLHRHYRERLAGAFLIQRTDDGTLGRKELKLSSLVGSVAAPCPIVNAALNLPSSRLPAMQGRLTDFFAFTPHYCGSPVTGYFPTPQWESANPDLDVGTAMAISGAAAAPQMGLASPGRMSFWLGLLNIRLGYWLARPGKRPLRAPGIAYLLREMFGKIDERAPYLNVSDGGHIENLGVMELLRRRCKFIISIDGEEDARMTFHAVANLQRMAAIDLGISIDLDLDDLRLNEHGLSRSHFRFARIRYSTSETGYLLYLKLSLTGNEGEFIRRYKLDEPNFPHHSTLNQLFTEPQFEAYRSLGEHVGEKTFLRAIVGDIADQQDVDVGQWFAAIADSFLEPQAR